MSNEILRVENLSKEYRLGVIGYGTLREDFQSWWARARGKEDPNERIFYRNTNDPEDKHFLALDDISFSVNRGDRIGIIGKNGAGKSTLLKILSRLTAPTRGRVLMKGHVSSLLEVGTGFHPELTGRENIYLNGTILGMKKREIDKKLDEIIDFSGVEKFVDTPVKRYSSGMRVRLGFAVAANLEPDILIVDEVLAVGDAEFQKKAIGKMEEVSNNYGRTILFVSHNMESVRRLCDRGILLDAGTIYEESNEINDLIQKYISTDDNQLNGFWISDGTFDNNWFNLINFRVSNIETALNKWIFRNDEQILLLVTLNIKEINKEFQFGFAVFTQNGDVLFRTFINDNEESERSNLMLGVNQLCVKLPMNLLNEGKYKVIFLSSIGNDFVISNLKKGAPGIQFEIKGGMSNTSSWISKPSDVLAPLLIWERV